MPQATYIVDPVVALSVFAGLVLLLSVLFWPRRGLVPRLMRLTRVTEQVRMEDTLKQLYRCEYEEVPATVESVAGALQIPRGRAVKLLERLVEMGLVHSDGAAFPLTEEGRAYALRVLRTHRLWERYLADRTGVAPAEWHEEAEIREHTLSPSEAESLSVALGNPLYDPHGDPIPTAGGVIPPRRGVPLTALKPGDTARISHLEDEPREVYEQLVAARLTPTMRIERLESPGPEVRFRTDRGVQALQPVVANSITVERLPLEVPRPGSFLTLADIGPGEDASVVGILPACQGAQRRRLLDLGVVPGTVIRAEFQGAAGGAVAYRIRDALIALRREQAARIQVQRVPKEQVG